MRNPFKRKSKFRFNWNLAQRFVNDYRLPIPIMGAEIFEYHINLYENRFGTKTKWDMLWKYIDNNYNGNPEEFLKDFYAIREKIVSTIPNSEAFKAFNTMDMNRFSVKSLQPRCSSLYNETNIGKRFISIDLTKGNFQALNYVDKNILLNSETYEDFISKFTNIYYIEESKYFRQVIFGQMNPKRHITVEKYMVDKVYDYLKENYSWLGDLVVWNSDELIFEVDVPNIDLPTTESIEWDIERELGIYVHLDIFNLDGWNLYSVKENHKRCSFFVKRGSVYNVVDELMCVPQPYFAIVYKLYNNLPLVREDFHFNYENIDCIFNDNFYIEKIEPKN
jgi:hypothetical protein